MKFDTVASLQTYLSVLAYCFHTFRRLLINKASSELLQETAKGCDYIRSSGSVTSDNFSSALPAKDSGYSRYFLRAASRLTDHFFFYEHLHSLVTECSLVSSLA